MGWREEEARLLFGGRWLPLTEEFAFLEADARVCVDSFAPRRSKGAVERTGCPLRVSEIRGSLEEMLGAMLPLVSGMAGLKYLFVPTAAEPGPWTAYVNNNWRGADLQFDVAAFASWGIAGVTVCDAPNSYDRASNTGFFGQRRIQVMYPDETHRHGFRGHSVGVQVGDSRRWEFIEPGPNGLPFPDPTDYSARRVPDRFTHDHLVQAAAWFGLRPFDEDFYAPDKWGVLVEHTEPTRPDWHEFTVEQARANGKGVLS